MRNNHINIIIFKEKISDFTVQAERREKIIIEFNSLN
jgi:hypothetical protein